MKKTSLFKHFIVTTSLVLIFGANSFAAQTTKPADTKKAAAPAASKTDQTSNKVDKNSVLKQIKEIFVCDNGMTIAEAEAENQTCAKGDYAVAVITRILDGTYSENDLVTLSRYFPQGRSLVTTLNTQSCSQNGKLKLEFFIMSYCPYGVRFVDGLLASMVRDLGDAIDWTPYYILNKDNSGKLSSLHGQTEVDEDLRQVCIREKAGNKKWLGYMGCFSKDIYAKKNAPNTGKDWKQCALEADINPDQIEQCLKEEVNTLVSKDISLSQGYGANGSPTAVYNCNKQIVGAIPYDQVKPQLCKMIQGEKPATCNAAQPAGAKNK